MTGDLEQGEREGAPDPWIPLGSAIPDDALIIAAARAARARGERIEFHETKLMNGGLEVAVTLLREVGSRSCTVPLKRDVAHGRRLALEALLKGDDRAS